EDPVDPGREASRAPEGGRAAIDLEKSLLHGVLGVGGIAEEVRGDALHASSMELVEALEGRDVARADPIEEGLVFLRLTGAIRLGQTLLLREKGDLRTIFQRRAKAHSFSTSTHFLRRPRRPIRWRRTIQIRPHNSFRICRLTEPVIPRKA